MYGRIGGNFIRKNDEKRNTEKERCGVAHRQKQIEQDPHKRPDSRPQERRFSADSVAQIRAQQKTDQCAEDLHQQKAAGAGGG
jgi:hypothetical protein